MASITGNWKGKSTADECVAAMRHNFFLVEVVDGKVRRKEQLRTFLSAASDDEKNTFLNNYVFLREMVFYYLAVSERLCVMFDNSTLQDVLHYEHSTRRKPRYYSLIALLMLVEDYCLADLFYCVTPAALYEANGRVRIDKESLLNEVTASITTALAKIGLGISYIGFGNSYQLLTLHIDIEHDEKEIYRALEEINSRDWKQASEHMLSGSIGMVVAEENVPEIFLRYFNPWYVKYILMMVIEKKIFAANPKFRKFTEEHKDDGVASIINVNRGRVNGLADIELLTLCDLRSQSVIMAPQIAMAISGDENLNRTLWSRLGVTQTLSFRGGDDPQKFASSFFYFWQREERVKNRMNVRAKEFNDAKVTFWREHLEEFFPVP